MGLVNRPAHRHCTMTFNLQLHASESTRSARQHTKCGHNRRFQVHTHQHAAQRTELNMCSYPVFLVVQHVSPRAYPHTGTPFACAALSGVPSLRSSQCFPSAAAAVLRPRRSQTWSQFLSAFRQIVVAVVPRARSPTNPTSAPSSSPSLLSTPKD